MIVAPRCRVTHGSGAALTRPFADLPLEMHELSAPGGVAFAGAYGFIPFETTVRLPRHVHLGAPAAADGARRLLAERILVLNGCGLVELAGALHVVAPGSLVEIGAGVPHTWTACPPGLRLPDGTRSDGTFLMVYQYEDATGFFPTVGTAVIDDADGYEPYEGDLEAIRIPLVTAQELVARVALVWNGDSRRLDS